MNLHLLIIFLCAILCNFLIDCTKKAVVVEEFSDPKQFKQLLRSRNNVMVLFTQSKSAANSVLKMYKDAAAEIRGIGTMIMVDCGGQGQKLCRQQKANPDPNAFHHFKDGKFHKVYDRSLTTKSLVRFMNDPTGEVPWEEEPGGKSVVHLETPSALEKIIRKHKKVLVMFYAPWCVYCKQMKPEFAAAAAKARSSGLGILAAMDVNRPENAYVRTKYKVTGFPTVHYFKDAQILATYEGENKDEQILEFFKDPKAFPPVKEKEKPWSEEESFVNHLNDTSFDTFIQANPSTLVMFYAPWCGHCKRMKPDWMSVAQTLHVDPKFSHHKLAAVDATKEVGLAERFKVKSFPTIKYFKDGEFAFDTPTLRSKPVIMEFLEDPSKPPATPPPEVRWEDTVSEVLHLTEDTFRQKLRSKKHALVMFYAPWCGHCKATKPEFESAAEQLKEDYRLTLAAVNCVDNQNICKIYDVRGYPTFKYFNYHKRATSYEGGRKAEDFVKYMRSYEPEPLLSTKIPELLENPNMEALEKLKQIKEKEDAVDYPGWDKLVHFTDENYKAVFEQHEHLFVFFHARWCRECRYIKPKFAELALEKPEHVTLAACDITKSPSVVELFTIKSLPVYKYIRGGKFISDFSGKPVKKDLQDFIQKINIKKDEL